MSGQALKDEGMARAASNRKELLERARGLLRFAAFERTSETVTADDLDSDLREQLGPAAGSLFKCSDFEFTGERVRSSKTSNHCRELKVWKLTPTGKDNLRKQKTRTRTQEVAATPQRAEPTPLPSWLR